LKYWTTILLTLFLYTNYLCQQNQPEKYHNGPKRYGSMQILGHSIVSYHFEHSLIRIKGFSLIGEIGLGLAEFSESEANPPNPAVYAFHTWFPIQYSLKGVEFIACVSPSLYKYGKLGFIDLNGMFGIRTNFSGNRFNKGIFLGIFYTPKIYQSVSHPEKIYSHFPVSLKIGASF